MKDIGLCLKRFSSVFFKLVLVIDNIGKSKHKPSTLVELCIAVLEA